MCEMPEAYVCSKPKARKEHTCCECRGKIFIGETYFKHHGVWEGEGMAFKVCEDCEKLRGEVDADGHTAFSYLAESVFETRDIKTMATFLEIKEKRNADIPQWMKDRIDDELNKQDEKEEHDTECELGQSNQ